MIKVMEYEDVDIPSRLVIRRRKKSFWQRNRRKILGIVTAVLGTAGIILLFLAEQDPRMGLAAIPILVFTLIVQGVKNGR